MRAFIAADVPKTCYLTEVLLWVALGRVPVALYDLNGHEIRSVHWYEESGYQPDGLDYYFEQEFVAIGVVVDYPKYYAATEEWAYCLTNEISCDSEKIKDRFHGYPATISAESLESLKYFDECNKNFDHLLERAKVKIFDMLMEGNLTGWGYIGESGFGPDFDEKKCEYTGRGEIEAKNWAIEACDWFEDSLSVGDKEYFMIQLDTHDVLKQFPKPLIPSKPAHGHSHGTSILVHDAETPIFAASRPKRGRPAKQDGVIRKVVQNVFGDRIRKGKAPEKAEALYQEVIEYVQLAFNEKISRTTAQGYIQRIQNQMPEILPQMNQ